MRMNLTLKNQIRKLSKKDYSFLKQMCRDTKNLYNRTLYVIKQHFEKTGEYLNYPKVYHLLKNDESFKRIKFDTNQQVLRRVDFDFKCFFRLLEKKRKGEILREVQPPKFLRKDSYWVLTITIKNLGIKEDYLYFYPPDYLIDKSKPKRQQKIKIPFTKQIEGKIKEVKIIPISNCQYFEIAITYEHDESKTNLNLNKENLLSIDCGLDNFATCLDCQSGRSFILDGRELKSTNRWWNKEVAKLRSVLWKQKKGGEKSPRKSKRLNRLAQWRKNQINNYLNQMVAHIVKYCAQNNIGNMVIGDWGDIKRKPCLGKITNQNFTKLPFSLFKQKLKHKCQVYGIAYQLQEENYTSKCSFLDQEKVCKHAVYQGKRIERGLFRPSKGIHVNADVNGAANIAVKSKLRDKIYDLVRQSSGFTSNPKRIRLLDFEKSQVKMSELVTQVKASQKQTSLEVA